MKKNGFTLVELLAVIVLMAILITIAVPGITKVTGSLKTQSLCSKIEVIEAAALEYADDYFSDKKDTTPYISYLDYISIADLINMGYLSKDDDTCTLYSAFSNCVTNPEDNSSLDYRTVSIWSTNNRLYASYLYTLEEQNLKKCGNIDYHIQGNYTKDTGSGITTKVDGKTITVSEKMLGVSTYKWSSYVGINIPRTSNIPGNYRISKIIVNYTLSPNTIMEVTGSSIDTDIKRNTSSSSITKDITYTMKSGETSGNYTFLFKGASMLSVNKEGYVKINYINVIWTKIS